MLFISDDLLIKSLDAIEKYNLEEFFNNKKFTVSDTPLSYRQANTLEEDKLLSTDRTNKKGWRKFSFKELVYILIVTELKKFGLKHEQIKQLWEVFFKAKGKALKVGYEPDSYESNIVLGCILGQVEITLCLFDNGDAVFYAPAYYSLLGHQSRPHVAIIVNNIVNKILKGIGKKEIPITWSISQLLLEDKNETGMTSKESKLLKLVRDKDFSAIKVKKKNGEIAIAYAERFNKNDEGTTVQELIKLLNKKDYQDISVVKRDGKIVSYKVEETYKL